MSGTVLFTPEKRRIFLESLADTCSVKKSAEIAGLSKVTLYNHKRSDAEFSKQWDEAKKIGAEALEDEAVRRAFDGVNGKYSDVLLIFLLKGAMPEKYAERTKSEFSGEFGVRDLSESELDAKIYRMQAVK